MTEKEKIIEESKKRLLTEMAIPRSQFVENLQTQVLVVINHLILCLTQPNSQDLNHWKGEIYGNFSKFDKLKYSKKYPTEQDFLDCGMENWFERIEDKMDSYIIDIYSEELQKDIFKIEEINLDINIEKLKICICNYLTWAIQNMNPDTGVINKLSAYNKIDEIIKEYNKN